MSIDERDGVAVQFGVPPEQVERDHLISHLLAAISRGFGDRLYFIGGTALARTYLASGRLSEDIDLVALDNRTALAAEGAHHATNAGNVRAASASSGADRTRLADEW
ncbi:nucleotidyl transferase AbiEii/AbiGii toxin family protein [Nocardia salmonicida]|uniref:nucleotidyl transferase AbiEii/AbiGii toxin family protein n=1 Tax=Nocardia salmonicida TaxID=53431 RepID=UPI0037AA3421